jgi:hypothetical protein
MGYPELWAKLCSWRLPVPLGFAVNRLWVSAGQQGGRAMGKDTIK